MLYTEKEKNEIERVRKVFEKHIQQMTAYDLVWSDKVGYVWLAISIDPVYIDTGNWIESAAGLCYECLVMSYLSERKGRTPRSCKMHLPPSITASSSWLISSFPNF